MSPRTSWSLLPGLALCGAVALAAALVEWMEALATGHRWLEGIVVAILLGALLRTVWIPSDRFEAGVRYGAKSVLECAVALMGATVGFRTVLAAGMPLIAGVMVTVLAAIAASFFLGRAFGLSSRMAMLVACGNAICGNSAIAAVAPTIDADSSDVATAVAFTAVLSIVVVVAIPLVAVGLHLNPLAGGALAGLTVYAVPQVVAAAAPMGPVALQIGTVVKLARVLMLGPVVACLSVITPRGAGQLRRASGSLFQFLPPFILAFLALAVLRSMGALPDRVVEAAAAASSLLTMLAMAALGLGVDLRGIRDAGPRMICVVTLSLLALTLLAIGALHGAGLA